MQGIGKPTVAYKVTVFAIDDPHSAIELVNWWARASADTRDGRPFGRLREHAADTIEPTTRRVYLPTEGHTEADVIPWGALATATILERI